MSQKSLAAMSQQQPVVELKALNESAHGDVIGSTTWRLFTSSIVHSIGLMSVISSRTDYLRPGH